MFSCEFSGEISKNTFFCRTSPGDRFCTLFLIITATTINISDVWLSFKFKRFQRIWIWYLIFTKSLPSVLFSFSIFFCLSQLFHFFLPPLKNRLKCFCPCWHHWNMFMLVNKRLYISCATDVEMCVLEEKSFFSN